METLFDIRALKKTFGRRTIFHDLSFQLKTHDALGVAGRNGSGKSTLVKILAGILSPTAGWVELSLGGRSISADRRYESIGFVSPYLQMYDEFTGWENLELIGRIRGTGAPSDVIASLLRRVRLFDRKDHLVRTYSSGMKQRLKYAFALLHQPTILILDEPTSNLDAEGIEMVHGIMEESKEQGILIVATNEDRDLEPCTSVVDLNAFAPGDKGGGRHE
jgi:heme exporter protein A